MASSSESWRRKKGNGIALLIAIVAYNNALSRWRPFNGPWYVPINLAASAALVSYARRGLGLGVQDLGLAPLRLSHGCGGAALGAGLATPLLLAAMFERTCALVADQRVAHFTKGGLAYYILVRIPLGTVLLEELAFRGVLQAPPSGAAALRSSLAFGLWHVGPTLNMIRANRPLVSRTAKAATVVAAVGLTAGGGAVLSSLRARTGSLTAPFGFHTAVNAVATGAGWVAARRLRLGCRPVVTE
jgi:membrane protease YdiL (CAAX protease family)